MKTSYLIAFGKKPLPGFITRMVELASLDDVKIIGALLVEGPGCANLAVMLPEPNDAFANALTMALMPAKWELTTDPQLVEGKFVDRINNPETA